MISLVKKQMRLITRRLNNGEKPTCTLTFAKDQATGKILVSGSATKEFLAELMWCLVDMYCDAEEAEKNARLQL